MRNTLILLSSLALAAVASATPTFSTSTASFEATLLNNPFVETLSVVQQAYHIYSNGQDGNVEDDLGGTLTIGHSASTSFGGDGVHTFSGSATATATLDSPDYSAVPHVFPNPGYRQTFQGVRFYLSMINRSAVDQEVKFHVKVTQSSTIHADGPYGPGLFDNNGTPITPGSYAEANPGGGAIDKSSSNLSDPLNEDYYTSLIGSGVAVSDLSASGTMGEYDAIFTLPARQAHVYQLFAGTSAYVQYVPVPEPASFAALGVGALALLRRRRKA